MTDPERVAKRHGDLYQKLIEESTDIATIIDPDGTITYVSPSVQRTLGYEPEELIGNLGYRYVHPDDREANADAVRSTEGEPSEPSMVEVRFRHADGTWCWIEAIIRDRLDDPVIDGILVTSRDISERKMQEKSRQKLADEYQTLLDNVEDAIFLLNVVSTESGTSFQFERLSPSYEEQTGITTSQVQNKTPHEVFGAERGAELSANYHRCARARKPISYVEELPIAKDARFWNTILAPVIADNEVTRIIGITRNVTERVRRERRLQAQNTQLEEFVSVVSHDLRNPLNVAQGKLGLLAEDCESDHLDPAEWALDRMDEIIQDTLTLARQGQAVSDVEAIDLNDLVDSCWQTVVTGDATLEVTADVKIIGDRSRLRNLFENLFQNAVHHGGTNILVRVSPFGEHGFYVEDDGPGIPEESRDTVLEPGHTSSSGGTGFGLTIVKRIAEAHGWELHITNSADDGARFEFNDIDTVQS